MEKKDDSTQPLQEILESNPNAELIEEEELDEDSKKQIKENKMQEPILEKSIWPEISFVGFDNFFIEENVEKKSKRNVK